MSSLFKICKTFFSLQTKLLDIQLKLFRVLVAPFIVGLAAHIASLIEPPDTLQLRTLFQFIAIVIYLAVPALLIEATIRKILKKPDGFLGPFKREAFFIASQTLLLFLIKSYEDSLLTTIPLPSSNHLIIVAAACLMLLSYIILHTLLRLFSQKG